MTELKKKKKIQSFYSRLDQVEESTNAKIGHLRRCQVGGQKNKKEKKTKKAYKTYRIKSTESKYTIMISPKAKEEKRGAYLKK